MSDAALIRECKAILLGPTAGTQANKDEPQPFEDGQCKPGPSNNTQQSSLAIVDVETQLLEELPAVIPKAEAGHQPALAQPPDQVQSHKNYSIPMLTARTEPNVLTAPPYSQTHPTNIVSCDTAYSKSLKICGMQSEGDIQSTDIATESCLEVQPPAKVSAMIESDSIPAARTASDHGGSSMNVLLQAMLTGSLAPG